MRMDIPKHNGSSLRRGLADSDFEESDGKIRVLVHQDALDVDESLSRRCDHASGERPSHFLEPSTKSSKLRSNQIFEPDDIITPLSEDSSPTDKDKVWEVKPSVEVEPSSVTCFQKLQCFGEFIDPSSMTLGRFFGLILSFGFYTADIVTNLLVCYHLFLHFKITWFALVAGFTIVPTLILNAVSYHLSISKMVVKRSLWNQSEACVVSVVVALLHLTQFGVFARYLCYIFLHELEYMWVIFCPNQKRKDFDHHSGKYVELPYLPYMFMIEAMLQCLPQLILQIFMLVEGQDSFTADINRMLVISIVVSLINLTRLMTLCKHSQKNFSTSWTGILFLFLWYLLTNISRVLSFSLFMTKFVLGFVLLCLCHWFILSIWAVKVLTPPVNCLSWKGFYKNCCNYLKGFLLGIMYLLCFMELRISDESERTVVPSRYLYFFFYSVIFMENSVLMVLWFVYDGSVWYGVPALATMFASFFTGLFCMYVYYRYFHKMSRAMRTGGIAFSCFQ